MPSPPETEPRRLTLRVLSFSGRPQGLSYIEVRMLFDQPQSIRTVFIDAGFTLIRPNPSTAEICQQVCQSLNLHVHLETVKQRMVEAQDYYYRHMRLNRQ